MTKIPNLEHVKKYFDQRVREHGASPRGADWNSESSQIIRFDQLLKVVETHKFSLLDYGCGYGALADHLATRGYEADYYGFDILESAIETARMVHAGKPRRVFFHEPEKIPSVDYTLASGVFNMRGEETFEAWTEYVVSVLEKFDHLSRRGFASNFLTMYSDVERMRPDLYYADP
jgi:SAM-dependent methyltransferase